MAYQLLTPRGFQVCGLLILRLYALYTSCMTDKLEHTLAALPPELRGEVEDFAAFLLAKRKSQERDTEGDVHPLARLAGAWQDESLTDQELLPQRSAGRDVDL